ncbi:MAG: Arc family DNA-binding protein [Gammaproteobacteria bacterium]|nr:Arc family DNA-binding protein [Gammaproteobacteria bacterium]
MATMTIRKPDDVEDRLRARAASNGRSVEEEACAILRDAVGEPKSQDTHAARRRTERVSSRVQSNKGSMAAR